MQMKSAPHLLNEDRAEYERVLEEALRNAPDRPDLAAIGQRLNAAQLRTMALNATASITGAAAAEYEHYVKIREETRASAAAAVTHDSVQAPDGPAERGAGLAAVIGALAPVLAGTAAVIFLLIGYSLRMLEPVPTIARSLVSAGWFFGALAAVAILAAGIGLLVTALRNGATQVHAAEAPDELPDEVARAKDAWRHALVERGVLPFLQTALNDPSVDPASTTPPRPLGRIPKVGYSGPDYSSPSKGATKGQRPTFTSPDFSSPDFGGPEHQPD
ncbi:hypothetical protein [Streptomyces sp. NBC_00690]|uniref:hypothetical protein n=1 Tax=Streptomyces sp. NBC_00690 TaxID=2975808 RepID=UPI002E2AF4FF|nr:hypothetical protein [Streptomyces sp. NBC_00690]